MSLISSTYKARDVEETLDIYFYRPFGYFLARIAKSLKMTPNAVTFFCMLFGVIAGHLFYYNSFTLDLIGIVLLIFSEALDSADGQLARMTQKYSRLGRILDGLATNFTFISIYIHLCLRMINSGTSDSVFLLAFACALSHSIQSSVADFYRNLYLHIVHNKGELDTFSKLEKEYIEHKKGYPLFEKIFRKLYLNYIKEQEPLTRKAQVVLENINAKYQGNIPVSIQNEYRNNMRSLLKYYNVLTTNTRMIALFISLFINNIMFYFLFEAVILNLLLAAVMARQNGLTLKFNKTIFSIED